MRRTLPVLILLLAATPLFAGPQEDVAKVVKDAVSSPEPTTAVFLGFASLPDFDLDGATVEAALRAGGAPAGGVVAQVLGNLRSVRKSGDTVEIHRSSAVVIPIVVGGESKGFVGLDKDVSFHIRRQGSSVQIDRTEGTSVGTDRGFLHDMKTLTFTKEGENPVITLTAGWGIITQTKRFVLPAPVVSVKAPTPPSPSPSPSPSPEPVALPLPPSPKPRNKAPAARPAVPPERPTEQPESEQPPETPGLMQKLGG